jgi:NAD(P)-dependent dehydrogenase (short-subunit alcohol dehydrogenase family)
MKHKIDQIKLNDKVILITGAGDGIGKAVSLECAKRGATIILLGKTTQKLEQVYDEIKASDSPEPAIYPMDLAGASAHDYYNLSDTIDKEFGKLDGLFNNAGWLGVSTPIEQYDSELWHKVLQVNLNAPFLLTQACLPLLNKSATKSTPASVVFSADQKQSAYWGAYGVAKSGLVTLMQILADELESKNISVNAFDPGPVHTNFRTQAYPAEDKNILNKPEDVTAPFVYLLNGECESVTGKVFTLDDFDKK